MRCLLVRKHESEIECRDKPRPPRSRWRRFNENMLRAMREFRYICASLGTTTTHDVVDDGEADYRLAGVLCMLLSVCLCCCCSIQNGRTTFFFAAQNVPGLGRVCSISTWSCVLACRVVFVDFYCVHASCFIYLLYPISTLDVPVHIRDCVSVCVCVLACVFTINGSCSNENE